MTAETAPVPPARSPASWSAPAWGDPADAQITWSLGRLHYPRPITILTHELRAAGQDVGMARADEALERPSRRVTRRLNGWFYRGLSPVDLPAELLAARRRRVDAQYATLARNIGDVWRAHLPEVEAILAAFDAVPLGELDREALLAELSLSLTRAARLWEIHFLVMPSALVAMERFIQLYGELFEGASELDATRLLQGAETKTVEAARALWRLAEMVRDDEVLRRSFERRSADDLLEDLDRTPEMAAFREAFVRYLAVYARRGITMDPAEPSVIERPGALLAEIRELLVSGHDPERRLREVRAERDAAVEAARERLRWYPQPVIDEFTVLLRAAQDGVMVQETHNFYIDFPTSHLMRIRAQALARFLVADGVLDIGEDIFHLTLEEIREAVHGRPAADIAKRIAGRRSELQRAATMDPPAQLGALPAGPPQSLMDRAGARFMGGPPAASEPGIVRGHPGSSGIARGIARVAHTPDEAGRVALGEILVTEMTGAPWTPLFARIAALVTDAGGALSHSAIVAREYGIPAVVGTGRGTVLIPDGATIEVDGDRGVVRIVDGS